jgi:phage tail sheath protein FI
MPGVSITTGAVSGPTAPGRAPASTYFVVGQAERGPADRVVTVTSFAEFARIFGGSTPYASLWPDVRTFFEEGGTRAAVARVLGPDATTGALSTALQDRNTTPGPTLTVAAASPGAWSSEVSVRILDGGTDATFRLQVLVGGKVVEDYANLRSPADAVSRINDGVSPSSRIRVANAGSTATAPDNNPAATPSPVTLTAGSDDRAALAAADYIEALDRFDDGMGDGAVGIPGLGSAVHDALVAHADAYNRIAILTSERAADKGELLGQAANLDAPRAGLFAPWIRVPDGNGGTRVVSPEGYVAAARARAHESAGPWRAGAGELSKARYVLSPDETFRPSDSDDLDTGKVNVIRTVAASTRVYGWRSCSADPANWKMLGAADVVNRVVTAARQVLEPYVFQPIDAKGHMLAAMAGTLEGVVKPMADAGGLFAGVSEDAQGNPVELDPGYRVVTGSELNDRTSLAADEVRAQLAIRPAPSAALVLLTVNKASVTAAL